MSPSETAPGHRLLTESLTALAAGAEGRRAWLDRHGVPADERAPDHGHAHRLVDHRTGVGRLDGEVLAELRAIDAVLSRTSGPDDAGRRSKDAPSTDPGRRGVRERARRVLLRPVGARRPPMPEIRVVR
ncbi:hypothetical protein ABT093_18245 [Kitasatospora sp. NPDC002551]|uniref:hypothetical protein n=1 Tax=Kitasatospora sp. NPDC002551 TaxID=3154539 RepID=UPI003326C1DF